MSEKTSLTQEGKLVGAITHYFGKIGVAVIKLSDNLKVGDKIRVAGGEVDFEQVIESMEDDHKKITKAKSGDSVGLQIEQKAREGYKVYRL